MQKIGEIVFAVLFNATIVSGLVWSVLALKRCLRTLKNGIETVGMYTGNQSGGNLIYNVRGQWFPMRIGWTRLSWSVGKTKFVVFYDPDDFQYACVRKYSFMTCLFRVIALGIVLLFSLFATAFILIYI